MLSISSHEIAGELECKILKYLKDFKAQEGKFSMTNCLVTSTLIVF